MWKHQVLRLHLGKCDDEEVNLGGQSAGMVPENGPTVFMDPGGGFKYFFNFHLYLGKIPILTNIFQMGWNHQLVVIMRILVEPLAKDFMTKTISLETALTERPVLIRVWRIVDFLPGKYPWMKEHFVPVETFAQK